MIKGREQYLGDAWCRAKQCAGNMRTRLTTAAPDFGASRAPSAAQLGASRLSFQFGRTFA
jgi:hypothetical protein